MAIGGIAATCDQYVAVYDHGLATLFVQRAEAVTNSTAGSVEINDAATELTEINGQWYLVLENNCDESVRISMLKVLAGESIDEEVRDVMDLMLEMHLTYAGVKIHLEPNCSQADVIEELYSRIQLFGTPYRLSQKAKFCIEGY